VNLAEGFRRGRLKCQAEAVVQDVCVPEGFLDGFDPLRPLRMTAGGVIFEAWVMDQARLHLRWGTPFQPDNPPDTGTLDVKRQMKRLSRVFTLGPYVVLGEGMTLASSLSFFATP
jgi:hypothetical protein